LIDPSWNASADLSRDFKQVLVDIYCPEAINLHAVTDQTGIKLAEKTLASVAQKAVALQSRYLKTSAYGENVYKVTDLNGSGCWWAYHYVKNDCGKTLNQVTTPALKNMAVVNYPAGPITEIVQSGDDSIILIRRTEGACSFGFGYSIKGPSH